MYSSLSAVYVFKGSIDEALNAAKRSIEVDPRSPRSWVTYGSLLGFLKGDLAGAARHFGEAVRISPSDFDWIVLHGHAQLALGDGDATRISADRAMKVGPNVGSVIALKVRQLQFAGDDEEALSLALETLASPATRHRSTSYLSLEESIIAIYFSRNEFAAAEAFLLKQYPELLDILQSAPPAVAELLGNLNRGGAGASTLTWTSVQELATIYSETGRGDNASHFRQYLAHYTPEQILSGQREVLYSGDYLRLAASGVGRLEDDKVFDLMEKSVELGYLYRWRRMIETSPHFWPLRNHPRFIALIERIEAEMARQLADLKARPTVFDVEDAPIN